jgi:hypothetical protein
MYSFTLNYALRGVILLFGLLGNLIVMVIFSTKNFLSFPSRNIYRVLILFDSIFLILSISNDFLMNFGIIWYGASELLCKTYQYTLCALVTPYFLVFISIERFITIRFPSNKMIKKHSFQTIIVFILFACNLIYFQPYLYLISFKININNTNISNENECINFDKETAQTLNLLGLIYIVGLPFVLMLTFTILLIYTILKSRLKILRLNNQRDRNRLKKDVQFVISSVFMNIFHLLLYLPVTVYTFLGTDFLTDLYYNIFLSLVYIDLCDHFYVLFCFNSVFRREFLIIFRLKSRLYRANTLTGNTF